MSSATVSASSANISDDSDAPSFTYDLTGSTSNVETGTTFTVDATLSADKSYTLYGAEYQLAVPTAFFTVGSVSAATGWEYGTATVDDDTIVTFTYLDTTGQAVEASTPVSVGSITLTPLVVGSTAITVNQAIVTRADALAYDNVTASSLDLTVAEGESDVTLGDLNSDGNINSLDAVLLARYRAGLINLTDQQLEAADLNGDGNVNSLDAVLLARYRAGLISVFPAAG